MIRLSCLLRIPDNVTLNIDGVLYLRVVDPYKASYGVEDPEFAITQLAQTTMRSEIGKISLDVLFREREELNKAIVEQINQVRRRPNGWFGKGNNDFPINNSISAAGRWCLGHNLHAIRDPRHPDACQGPGGHADAGEGREEEESRHPRV